MAGVLYSAWMLGSRPVIVGWKEPTTSGRNKLQPDRGLRRHAVERIEDCGARVRLLDHEQRPQTRVKRVKFTRT